MNQPAFELKHVTRRFGRKTAVDRVSLSQHAGTILGLAGLTGSGRTTLLLVLAGLVKPTAGQVQVLGGSPLTASIRARIGYAPETDILDSSLTIGENMVGFGRLKGFSRQASQQVTGQLLEELLLESARPVAELSASSRQVLCAGVALIGNPDLLLLGGTLDNLAEADLSLLQSVFRDRAARGRTIVIAGHDLPELGSTCDSIALLHQGSLLGKATPEEIRASVRGLLFKYLISGPHPVLLDLQGIETRFTGSSTEVLADQDIADLLDQQFGANTVEEVEPSFEEACLWILRNPEKISARSRMWEQGNSVAAENATG